MITVDIESDEPLFSQLITQIKNAIKHGDVDEGSALPSIRQLAAELDINNKTVAKAYKLLERDHVIESKGYRGSFVCQNAKQFCEVEIQSQIETVLNKAVKLLREQGATSSEIRIAFNEVMKK